MTTLARNEIKSSDKELWLTALPLSNMNLAMFVLHVSDTSLSALALKPVPDHVVISPFT